MIDQPISRADLNDGMNLLRGRLAAPVLAELLSGIDGLSAHF